MESNAARKNRNGMVTVNVFFNISSPEDCAVEIYKSIGIGRRAKIKSVEPGPTSF